MDLQIGPKQGNTLCGRQRELAQLKQRRPPFVLIAARQQIHCSSVSFRVFDVLILSQCRER
jgi:hypothetical protein